MSVKSWKLIIMKQFSLLLPFSEKVSPGFINIDDDWLFLQGKCVWQVQMPDLTSSPIRHHLPSVRTSLLVPKLQSSAMVPASPTLTESCCCLPLTICQQWMVCRWAPCTWHMGSCRRRGTAMLPVPPVTCCWWGLKQMGPPVVSQR